MSRARFLDRRPALMIAPLLGASLLTFCPRARAELRVEVSMGAGFGLHVAGVMPGRFTINPSASFSVRGDGWFLVARDTVSFLGATGGRFGITNETTLGVGLFWRFVNVSAGPSLMEYSLPICGTWLCAQVHGIAPGASVRLDVFGPFLSSALGASTECAGAWITGSTSPVWSGVALRCSVGPIFRFTSQP